MEECYQDTCVTADKTATNRTNFDDNVMKAIDERDLDWEAAKRVLGHTHAIFNHFDNKGKNTKTHVDKAPAKAIKNWRTS